MLTIGKLGHGQETYYLDAVADAMEEYYVFAGEAPGRWSGSGSSELGLQGAVGGDDFTALLRGVHPATGEALSRHQGKVPGFDLTFSAPKSVSLLFALGDPGTSARMAEAHQAAVEQALEYMESVASYGRRGHGGIDRITTRGFVAASFRHRTSRAGDPNLHTHAVVVNRVLGVDGRWTALDARTLYQQARTAGHLYQAALRHELRDLSLTWTVAPNGLAEIDQVPVPVRREFSRRRVEIEQLLQDRGLSSPAAAQAANLASRQAKGRAVRDGASVVLDWEERAAVLGFDATAVVREAVPTPVRCEPALDVDRLLGPDGLTMSASTFGERDVLRAVANALPQGAPLERVRELAAVVITSSAVIPLADRAGHTGRDPALPFGAGARRFTTRELLALERALVTSAAAMRSGAAVTVARGDVETALDRHPLLSEEQRHMVRALTLTADGVQVVEAPAGSGKTTALAAVVDAYASASPRVVGTTLSAKAAGVLRDQAGLPTYTLTRFLADLREESGRLAPGTVVIVDEASQVGTRSLAEVMGAVRRAGGKLILVGDPHQLPEIDAGGAYRGLLSRLDPVVLSANHRQRDPADRARLAELRKGDVAVAMTDYDLSGLVTRATTSDALREVLVQDWAAAFLPAEEDVAAAAVVMLGLTNQDVDDLNARARQLLVDAGRVAGTRMTAGGRQFQPGDHVVTRRNDRRRGVLNGERWLVTDVAEAGLTLLPIGRDGGPVLLPVAYADHPGWLQHGYALTVSVSQGSSVDRAFILGSDATYREAGYTAASRARDETRFYVVGREPGEAEHARDRDEEDPLDAVTAALQRSAVQDMAVDTWSDIEPRVIA